MHTNKYLMLNSSSKLTDSSHNTRTQLTEAAPDICATSPSQVNSCLVTSVRAPERSPVASVPGEQCNRGQHTAERKPDGSAAELGSQPASSADTCSACGGLQGLLDGDAPPFLQQYVESQLDNSGRTRRHSHEEAGADEEDGNARSGRAAVASLPQVSISAFESGFHDANSNNKNKKNNNTNDDADDDDDSSGRVSEAGMKGKLASNPLPCMLPSAVCLVENDPDAPFLTAQFTCATTPSKQKFSPSDVGTSSAQLPFSASRPRQAWCARTPPTEPLMVPRALMPRTPPSTRGSPFASESPPSLVRTSSLKQRLIASQAVAGTPCVIAVVPSQHVVHRRVLSHSEASLASSPSSGSGSVRSTRHAPPRTITPLSLTGEVNAVSAAAGGVGGHVLYHPFSHRAQHDTAGTGEGVDDVTIPVVCVRNDRSSTSSSRSSRSGGDGCDASAGTISVPLIGMPPALAASSPPHATQAAGSPGAVLATSATRWAGAKSDWNDSMSGRLSFVSSATSAVSGGASTHGHLRSLSTAAEREEDNEAEKKEEEDGEEKEGGGEGEHQVRGPHAPLSIPPSPPSPFSAHKPRPRSRHHADTHTMTMTTTAPHAAELNRADVPPPPPAPSSAMRLAIAASLQSQRQSALSAGPGRPVHTRSVACDPETGLEPPRVTVAAPTTHSEEVRRHGICTVLPVDTQPQNEGAAEVHEPGENTTQTLSSLDEDVVAAVAMWTNGGGGAAAGVVSSVVAVTPLELLSDGTCTSQNTTVTTRVKPNSRNGCVCTDLQHSATCARTRSSITTATSSSGNSGNSIGLASVSSHCQDQNGKREAGRHASTPLSVAPLPPPPPPPLTTFAPAGKHIPLPPPPAAASSSSSHLTALTRHDPNVQRQGSPTTPLTGRSAPGSAATTSLRFSSPLASGPHWRVSRDGVVSSSGGGGGGVGPVRTPPRRAVAPISVKVPGTAGGGVDSNSPSHMLASLASLSQDSSLFATAVAPFAAHTQHATSTTTANTTPTTTTTTTSRRRAVSFPHPGHEYRSSASPLRSAEASRDYLAMSPLVGLDVPLPPPPPSRPCSSDVLGGVDREAHGSPGRVDTPMTPFHELLSFASGQRWVGSGAGSGAAAAAATRRGFEPSSESLPPSSFSTYVYHHTGGQQPRAPAPLLQQQSLHGGSVAGGGGGSILLAQRQPQASQYSASLLAHSISFSTGFLMEPALEAGVDVASDCFSFGYPSDSAHDRVLSVAERFLFDPHASSGLGGGGAGGTSMRRPHSSSATRRGHDYPLAQGMYDLSGSAEASLLAGSSRRSWESLMEPRVHETSSRDDVRGPS